MQLKKHALHHIIFSAGYRAEAIISYFGNGKKGGILIDYMIEREPLYTEGALKKSLA